jgi:hypothetical protein
MAAVVPQGVCVTETPTLLCIFRTNQREISWNWPFVNNCCSIWQTCRSRWLAGSYPSSPCNSTWNSQWNWGFEAQCNSYKIFCQSLVCCHLWLKALTTSDYYQSFVFHSAFIFFLFWSPRQRPKQGPSPPFSTFAHPTNSQDWTLIRERGETVQNAQHAIKIHKEDHPTPRMLKILLLSLLG